MTFTAEEERLLQWLAVEQALDRLEPNQRLVMRYTYWWGLHWKEVVRRLQLRNMGQLQTIWRSARRRLQKDLA